MIRRLALFAVACGIAACANDYDQFTFGPPPNADADENPPPDVSTDQPSAHDTGTVDRVESSDGREVGSDVPGSNDGADVLNDAGPTDADAGVVPDAPEDAPTDVPVEGGVDVPTVDGGGDADVSVVEDGGDADAPADVSVENDGAIADAPNEPDAACEAQQKRCGDHCVGLDDPMTGCANPTCDPCNLPHATARCAVDGKCVIDTCEPGFDDCVKAPDDGCETSISTDVAHCGACDRACSDAHVASRECRAGFCVSTCVLGFANCQLPGTGPDDGCERDVSMDSASCGGCANDCSAQAPGLVCGAITPNLCGCTDNASCRVGGSNGSCDDTGLCKCGPSQCRPGETCRPAGGPDVCSCNAGAGCGATETCCGFPAGCRDLTTDPESCGACGHACPSGFGCVGSACACTADGQCNAGSNGTCAAGQCVCNGTVCATGQRCLPGGGCG